VSGEAVGRLVDAKIDVEVGLPHRTREADQGAQVRLRLERSGWFPPSAPDGGDGEPGVAKGLGGKRLDLVEGLTDPVGSTVEPPPPGSGVKRDGDETVAHGVMDVAGDPHALRYHGRGGLGLADVLKLLITQAEQGLLGVPDAQEITDREGEGDDEQI
jgi:hypothetical protein